SGQLGAGRIKHAPRSAHLRVSRAENVEAFPAEPCSSDVFMFFERRPTLSGLALVPVAREYGPWCTDVAVRYCGCCRQCLHLPCASASGMEHEVYRRRFFLTAGMLGLLLAASVGIGDRHGLLLLSVAAASGQILNQAARFCLLSSSESFELRASAQLLSTIFASRFFACGALLLLGGIVLPLFFPNAYGAY